MRRDVGCDGHLLHLLYRELRLGAESAYGVYVVAEKVDAVGQLMAVAENVENRATEGKLSGFIHVVHLRERIISQPAHRFRQIGLTVKTQMECMISN